jgi:hypothetical protein
LNASEYYMRTPAPQISAFRSRAGEHLTKTVAADKTYRDKISARARVTQIAMFTPVPMAAKGKEKNASPQKTHEPVKFDAYSGHHRAPAQ